VLLADTIQATRNKAVSRLALCRSDGPFDQAARRLRPFMVAGNIVPLASFDSHAAGLGDETVFFRLLVLGDDKVEVEAQLGALDRAGIRTGGWRPPWWHRLRGRFAARRSAA